MSKKRLIYALILLIAYAPLIGIAFSNRLEPKVLGLPMLWVYCLAWSLSVFGLLVISYLVDKMYG